MIHEKACANGTKANITVSESERCPPSQPALDTETWHWILITIMSFLLGLTVLVDSAALIGLA